MTRNTQLQSILYSNLNLVIFMEERSNNKNRITKTGDLLRGTTEKLGSSKDIDGNGKRSHKEVV